MKTYVETVTQQEVTGIDLSRPAYVFVSADGLYKMVWFPLVDAEEYLFVRNGFDMAPRKVALPLLRESVPGKEYVVQFNNVMGDDAYLTPHIKFVLHTSPCQDWLRETVRPTPPDYVEFMQQTSIYEDVFRKAPLQPSQQDDSRLPPLLAKASKEMATLCQTLEEIFRPYNDFCAEINRQHRQKQQEELEKSSTAGRVDEN